MQTVIEAGRLSRERRTVSLKTPLKELIVIHSDPQYLEDVKSLESYIKEELNIRDLTLSSDEKKYAVEYSVLADSKNLGIKFKKDAAKVKKALPNLPSSEIKLFLETGSINVEGCQLSAEDLRVQRGIKQTPETKNLEVAVDGGAIVILDSFAYPELAQEGLAREFLNRVQRLRKKVGLVPTDDVRVTYKVTKGDAAEVAKMFEEQSAMFEKAAKEVVAEGEGQGQVSGEEEAEVRDITVLLKLVKL
jgi:isoleucyl-tRNA synthetase